MGETRYTLIINEETGRTEVGVANPDGIVWLTQSAETGSGSLEELLIAAVRAILSNYPF